VIPALAVAAVALAIRALVAEFLPLIDHDGVIYVTIARQVHASGSPFDPLYHPLYPLFIALAEPLVGNWETTGRWVSSLFGALVILPAFALARGIVGRQAALLSAVLIAVHPRLVLNSASVLCEATYTFLLVSAVLAARASVSGSPTSCGRKAPCISSASSRSRAS
jgi:predicted membrane-bound mannosyltransferase